MNEPDPAQEMLDDLVERLGLRVVAVDQAYGEVRGSPVTMTMLGLEPPAVLLGFKIQAAHAAAIELPEGIAALVGDKKAEVSLTDGYELLPAPFRIARDVTVPAGGYALGTFRGQFTLGQQRVASGTIFAEHGPFYDGDRTALGYSGARVKLNPHLAVEPGVSINRVTLPFGSFTTKLLSSRVTYTITPMMFVGGLVQYNSSNSSFGANLRLRWEYQPGSELFLVYNEGRDTLRAGFPDLQTRALIVKVNRLFRF